MKKSDTITILMFGDVFGRMGRQAVAKTLPILRRKYGPDIVIANAENIAHGSGMTKRTVAELREAGVDFFTGGNHTFDAPQGIEVLQEKDPVAIRPLNLPKAPGVGYKVLTFGKKQILVINLLGQVFMKQKTTNPFKAVDKLLKTYQGESLHAILVDMHAETTSEKVAMGRFLDGRVSAVVGTHSHIQTADEQILDKGTAYITDIGMTGPKDSVIGLNAEEIVAHFLKGVMGRATVPEHGLAVVTAVVITVQTRTRKASAIKRISITTKL